MRLICARRLCVVVFLFGCARSFAADPAPAKSGPPVAPKIYKGEGWAVAAPENWSVFPNAPPPTVLYLIGDGREGVPLFDGTLSALKAGLEVRRFGADARAVKGRVEQDLNELKESGRFTPTEEARVEEVTLADGRKASLLRAEFVRRENGRLSIQQKLYCQDADGRHVVATGFITCGRPGAGFVRAIHLPEFVEAHVRTLVLDPAKADETKLSRAYAALDWDAAAAIRQTSRANEMLEKQDVEGAARAFRAALRQCPHVPAAHNGLAWALLEIKDDRPQNLVEALREAQAAVEQTGELDYSALDTLAFAHQRRGERDAALDAARKALKLKPDHPDLRRRLESLEGK